MKQRPSNSVIHLYILFINFKLANKWHSTYFSLSLYVDSTGHLQSDDRASCGAKLHL